MNIVDIAIILLLIAGFASGLRQGFTRALVNLVGVIIIAFLAYILKNPVSEILMNIFPFFTFDGIIKGITVLNIALYELIAFLLVFAILFALLKIVSTTTRIFERILSMTIILGIPSKILGAILGTLKAYILIFFTLYLLSFPNIADAPWMESSKLKEPILKETPVLSEMSKDMNSVISEFASLKDKYENTEDSNEFNLETLDIFLKYKIVTYEQIKKLSDSGKINIVGIEQVLEKYKEEENGNN